MAIARQKSAIRELRDQLFLDRADGKYLSVVSSNIGFDRPQFGAHNDSLWRAAVKHAALDYKSVETIFHDILTVTFGPRITVAAVAAEAYVVGTTGTSFLVHDHLNIPQRGTLVIDEGLGTEETVTYTLIDRNNGELFVESALASSHSAYDEYAESYLTSSVSASGTSITVWDASLFPDPVAFGSNYPILLDAGLPTEEVVTCTAKTGNVLTVTALTYDHAGPTASPIVTTFSSISINSYTLYVGDNTYFPASGVLILQEDGGTPTENVRYSSRDDVSNYFTLQDAVSNTYSSASVTLANQGAKVQLAQLQVKGVGWDIYQTESNKLKIYLPTALSENRLLDVSFVHNSIAAPVSKTVSATATAGDTVLHVSDASLFPNAGVVRITGGTQEDIGYYRIDKQVAIINDSGPSGLGVPPGSVIPAGETVLYVDNALPFYEALQENLNEAVIDIDGSPEAITIQSVDLAANSLTLTSATTATHPQFETINLNTVNQLYLTRGLENSHSIGYTVDLYYFTYAGTDLLDGRIGTANDHLFQGSYAYYILERLAQTSKTTLTFPIAGPTPLVAGQVGGTSCIEVEDARFFNSTDYQQVRIGRNLGNSETVDITDITLQRDVTGVTTTLAITGGVSTSFDVSGGHGLPEVSGYRLFIDDDAGGTGEEVVIVRSVVGNTVTIDGTAQKDHSFGCAVRLMADVISTDVLAYSHEGLIPTHKRTYLIAGQHGGDWLTSPIVLDELNTRVANAEEIVSYIRVADSTSFEADGGGMIVNFGEEISYAVGQLDAVYAAGATAVDIEDGSSGGTFPLFNFHAIIGQGLATRETVFVTTRTGTNLSFPGDGLIYDHRAGEDVQVIPGEHEYATYTGKDTGKLLFSPSVTFGRTHEQGENVFVNTRISLPSIYGNDFPAYLPSTWGDIYKFLFDLVRAAGVQIEILTDL